MDYNTKKLIEKHFYNYEQNRKRADEGITEIAESGLVPSYDRELRPTHKISRPTENKALRLGDSMYYYKWAKVVENTINSFRFMPEHEIMYRLYIEKQRRWDIIRSESNPNGIIGKSTYYYWKNNWLDRAEQWALYYDLIPEKGYYNSKSPKTVD